VPESDSTSQGEPGGASPLHLRPTAPLADRVLLPGDPHRALAVAQAILEEPRMFNHTRGLWGYTGRARDGEPLTVQATGMGAPSAAIVVQELIDLGARTLVRIGTCGALDGGLGLGTLVSAEHALATDGASRALAAGERVAADPGLAAALTSAGAVPVRPSSWASPTCWPAAAGTGSRARTTSSWGSASARPPGRRWTRPSRRR
jgi:phosphorylase superfamily protein